MILEEIKKAYEQAVRTSMAYEFPNRISMSDETFEKLSNEVRTFVCMKDLPAPCRVYGMEIICDNRLREGVFVIGGLIGPVIDKTPE